MWGDKEQTKMRDVEAPKNIVVLKGDAEQKCLLYYCVQQYGEQNIHLITKDGSLTLELCKIQQDSFNIIVGMCN